MGMYENIFSDHIFSSTDFFLSEASGTTLDTVCFFQLCQDFFFDKESKMH